MRMAKRMKVSPDAAVSLRLPTDLLRRVDALIPSIAITAVSEGETRVSRSWTLRRALEVGVEELERRARKTR
jgi:hypothetical protein